MGSVFSPPQMPTPPPPPPLPPAAIPPTLADPQARQAGANVREKAAAAAPNLRLDGAGAVGDLAKTALSGMSPGVALGGGKSPLG